ncbi:hypothetical protein AB0G00_16580 [Nocardia salmonicida]|uniref:hypothetical protein n=1 Tax=Nocardia salmonicida TaxID=53431 RepID=UPI0033D3EA01
MSSHPAGTNHRRAQAAAHRLTDAGYPTPVRCACPERRTTTTTNTNTETETETRTK